MGCALSISRSNDQLCSRSHAESPPIPGTTCIMKCRCLSRALCGYFPTYALPHVAFHPQLAGLDIYLIIVGLANFSREIPYSVKSVLSFLAEEFVSAACPGNHARLVTEPVSASGADFDPFRTPKPTNSHVHRVAQYFMVISS